MKGLFKGLRCMFESEKEPEIQIGMPTDVKHVAHIGCDGPSTNAPSWMTEFQGGSEASPASPNLNAGAKDPGIASERPSKTKQSRRHTAGDSSNPKPRRNKNSNSEEETSRTRRIKNSILGPEEPPNVKKTRKKKGPSKTKNKDPSTTDASGLDSDCGDEVCLKPLD